MSISCDCLKVSRRCALAGLITFVSLGRALSAPAPGQGKSIPLPNPSFEKAGQGSIANFTTAGFDAPEGDSLLGPPDGWVVYQWGSPGEARFSVGVEKGMAHTGLSSLQLRNTDASARGGVYTHANLAAGTYELSVWARAAEGKTGRLAVYLASAYSRPYRVKDQWTRIAFTNTVGKATERAEINLQNASGLADSVLWVDDVELRPVATVKFETTPDRRKSRPRTLLFSPMNVNYLRDTAKDWAARGFRGFLFDGVMASWPSEVWSVDGDPKTRDEKDVLLREVRACNDECRRYGIDSNFVKVAFYDELPDWFDEAAWTKLTENFRQGARFAKLSGCVGIALDTEYKAHQFDPGWEGYKQLPHDVKELKAKVRERWRAVVAAMLKEYPNMVLLTLPEGMIYYGELYFDLFTGMLQACAEAKAPGGLHVMTEGTYHITSASALSLFPETVSSIIKEDCAKPLVDYWRKRCSVVMGVWPLGYYRSIVGASGKFLGYGGKTEVFGDKVIGSYSDKSEWFPVSEFREQMSGVNSFCPRYNWIYSHGAVFWQWTDGQLAKYQQGKHQSASNSTLPTVPNLNEYFDIIAHPMRVQKVATKAVSR
ncbi:MAG: hypothetical protein HY318_19725 [Armatimonadetes bacterium]|nr:hypothetical protein [Armatimonadota bacterium]